MGNRHQQVRRADLLLIKELRDQLAFFKKQYAFLQGKCERLELTLLEQRSGAGYVDRTERPKIGDTAIDIGKAAKRLPFGRIKEEWDKLSAEEQEQHIQKGDWQLQPPGKKKARN